MNRNTFNSYILESDFRSLFIMELGWNKPKGNTRLLPIVIDEIEYRFTCVAERNGLQVVVTDVANIPTNSLARRIDAQLRKQAQDYIAIFMAKDHHGHHAWVVPVKNVDKRDLVSIEYESPSKADFLIQKLDHITFNPAETTTIVDVKEGVHRAFAVNAEKITKDFYSGFKKEHTAFAKFITGIDDNVAVKDNRNKQWYASVMLNRLMFCYFIQKKGFLDGKVNYLREKLDWVRREQGENRFFGSFYKEFLTRLFADGLNAPQHDRNFIAKFGRIPYLNGGMFDRHQIERDYADIDIADDAFISLFAFFDKWRWHLDTRVTESGRDINPDVLGYIFEQYINDRAAMGAYYTKEDITEYIGRSTILPFLFDKVAKKSDSMAKLFAPGGWIWNKLKDSGDRYIFDAVKQGYTSDWRERIPSNIAIGLDTTKPDLLERRKDWNTRTPEPWALPTEIWRETVERLQRCESILGKIKNGEITSINDFITYNLDIRLFAADLIVADDAAQAFVYNFYDALRSVTVLDPTCGSGAFLFAAMNILEPLYYDCISKLESYPNKSEQTKAALNEIKAKYRSNIHYFIFKSIILRNLYGVDIMAEATEIAKLRLFLKMVAVVDVDYRADNLGLDPLPDIDFNIRCGNTLVGYATEAELLRDLSNPKDFIEELANQDFKAAIELELSKAKDAYDVFRETQLSNVDNMAAFKKAKDNLNKRLQSLNEQLNQRLFSATGTGTYEKWLVSHQPFHWLAEYYAIIQDNGGFDVIIGNPPYVIYAANKFVYQIHYYQTIKARNLYAFCIERALKLVNEKSYCSMIVPISLSNGTNYVTVRELLSKRGTIIYSHYAGDSHPSCLFNGVQQNLTIFNSSPKGNAIYTTNYVKSYNEERINLFFTLSFNQIEINSSEIIRLGSILQTEIYKKLIQKKSISNWINPIKGYSVFFKNTSGAAYKPFFSEQPFFQIDGIQQTSKTIDTLSFSTIYQSQSALGMYNSNLFNFLFLLVSDARHITPKETLGLLTIDEELANDVRLHQLSMDLQNDYNRNSIIVTYNKKNGLTQYAQFNPRLSKPIIDEIDRVLAEHYGFTEEELDFIINYDIKYRMGDELNSDE